MASYYGTKGEDVTGIGFRYGEQVEPGLRGVWKQALPPGKYALNPYALKVELVPTVIPLFQPPQECHCDCGLTTERAGRVASI